MARQVSLVAVGVALALAGCAAFPDTSEEAIARALRRDPILVPCLSTIGNLRAQLGQPSRVDAREGDRILHWTVHGDGSVRYLSVLADASDTVVDLRWSDAIDRDWSPVNRCN